MQRDQPGDSRDIQVRDGGNLHQGNGCEAGALGTGRTDIQEAESTSGRLGMAGKGGNELRLMLRSLAEITGLNAAATGTSEGVGQQSGYRETRSSVMGVRHDVKALAE